MKGPSFGIVGERADERSPPISARGALVNVLSYEVNLDNPGIAGVASQQSRM